METSDGWFVGLSILCFRVSSIEQTYNFTRDDTGVMHLHVLEINGNPTSVDQDSALLTLIIQMSIERSDYFNTFFSISQFFYLEFLVMIEESSDLNLLEWIIIFELVDVLSLWPQELPLICWGNVNWLGSQEEISVKCLKLMSVTFSKFHFPCRAFFLVGTH